VREKKELLLTATILELKEPAASEHEGQSG